MNTLRDYVDWKLTHPQGYMSRNIFYKDIVYFKNAGWNLDRDTSIVTDKSFTAYGDKDSQFGSLALYLGDASDFAGKTLSMTFTPETDFTYPNNCILSVFNNSWSSIVSVTSAEWEGGYHCCITVPAEPEKGTRLGIRIYGRNLTQGAEVKIDNIMIYEGTEPLPYEPYGKFIKK